MGNALLPFAPTWLFAVPGEARLLALRNEVLAAGRRAFFGLCGKHPRRGY